MTGTVKALEWTRPSPRDSLTRAITDLGVYRAYTYHEADGRWFWSLDGYIRVSGEGSTEQEVQAAAQADYERRILSSLTASASEPVAFDPMNGGCPHCTWLETNLGSVLDKKCELHQQIEDMQSDNLLARQVQAETSKVLSAVCEAIDAGDEDDPIQTAQIRMDELRAAEQVLGEIEQRFPDWRGFRDLVDCIDVTLHNLRSVTPVPTPDGAVEALIEKYASSCKRNAAEMETMPLPAIMQHFREFAHEVVALGRREPFDNLSHIVQYCRTDGSQRWTNMAAFDSERIAEKYRDDCAKDHTLYWEYRVVPAAPAAKPEGQ